MAIDIQKLDCVYTRLEKAIRNDLRHVPDRPKMEIGFLLGFGVTYGIPTV